MTQMTRRIKIHLKSPHTHTHTHNKKLKLRFLIYSSCILRWKKNHLSYVVFCFLPCGAFFQCLASCLFESARDDEGENWMNGGALGFNIFTVDSERGIIGAKYDLDNVEIGLILLSFFV